MFGWRLIRINGHSMAPTLDDGDYALARIPSSRRQPVIGDVVLFQRNGERPMIKRLADKADNDSFLISGDGALSAPRVDLGPVKKDDIQACLVVGITPTGLRSLK